MTTATHPDSRRTDTNRTRGGLTAWAIGIICGAELFFAALIGGAGTSALLGLNGAVVAATLAIAVASTTLRRQRRTARDAARYGDRVKDLHTD